MKYQQLFFSPKFGVFPAGSVGVGQGQRVQFTGVTRFPLDGRGSVLDLQSGNVALSQVAARGRHRHKRWGLHNSTHVANPLPVSSINARPSCNTLLFYDKIHMF